MKSTCTQIGQGAEALESATGRAATGRKRRANVTLCDYISAALLQQRCGTFRFCEPDCDDSVWRAALFRSRLCGCRIGTEFAMLSVIKNVEFCSSFFQFDMLKTDYGHDHRPRLRLPGSGLFRRERLNHGEHWGHGEQKGPLNCPYDIADRRT
jgi:hypothetical protein